MKICNGCGTENPEGARFCRNCGASMETKTQNPQDNIDNGQTGNGTQYDGGQVGGGQAGGTPIGNGFGNNGGAGGQNGNNGNKTLIAVIIGATAAILLVVILALTIVVPQILGILSDKEDDQIYVEETATPESEWVEPTSDPTPIPEPTKEPEYGPQYTVYKTNITWNEANQYALRQGGYLVCINSAQEFNKVCALADAKGIKVFWAGAKRGLYDDWFDTYWHDGEQMYFTNWLSGEPTYYSEDGEEERYLMIFKVGNDWYYNDAINDVSQYYSGKMGYIVETER